MALNPWLVVDHLQNAHLFHLIIIRFQTDASMHLLYDWFSILNISNTMNIWLSINRNSSFFNFSHSYDNHIYFFFKFSWKLIDEIAAIKSSKMTKNATVAQAKNVNMIHAAIALHVN